MRRGRRWLVILGILAVCGAIYGIWRLDSVALPFTEQVQPTATPTPTQRPTARPTVDPDATEIPPDMLFDITVFPPTCLSNGYSVYVSKETGGINIRDEVPRLMHEYGDWTVDLETGAMTRACAMCGTEEARPADGLPRLALTGDPEGMSRETAVDFRLDFACPGAGFSGWARMKWLDEVSEYVEKKSYALKLYDDEACAQPHAAALAGGAEDSFALDACCFDFSMCRTLACEAIWGNMAKSRADVPERLAALPNGGAGWGTPVTLYLNGEFYGLYTLNLSRPEAIYGVEPGDAVALCGEDLKWTPAYGEAAEALRALDDFIENGDAAAFRAEAADYIDVDAAIDCLLYMYATGCSDPRGAALVKYGDGPWMPCAKGLYTSFGLNKGGADVADADAFLPVRTGGIWDSGTGNGLWDRLLNAYEPEILARWTALRQGALSEPEVAGAAEALMDGIPEEVYRADRTLYRRSSVFLRYRNQIADYIHERFYVLDGALGVSIPETDAGETPEPEG